MVGTKTLVMRQADVLGIGIGGPSLTVVAARRLLLVTLEMPAPAMLSLVVAGEGRRWILALEVIMLELVTGSILPPAITLPVAAG